MPRVSFCIPNLNMKSYLAQCVLSCLTQTVADLEVVILDNNSDDGSHELAMELAGQDQRIKVFRNYSRLGMAANWNKCIRHAHGEYVVLLCADDTQEPLFIEHLLPLLDAYPGASFACGERNDIDVEDRLLCTHQFYESSALIPGLAELEVAIASNHSVLNQLLLRRCAWEQVGGFDERFDWAHDIHLKLKMMLIGDVVYTTKPVCNYRINPEASSSRMLSTKLGPMEIYRVRHDILQRLPSGAIFIQARLPAIKSNIARICLKNGLTLSRRDGSSAYRHVAMEYLYLAKSFDLEIANSDLYRQLDQTLSGLIPLPVPALNAQPRPYPLPKQAQRIDC